jgi:hypothetical protein
MRAQIHQNVTNLTSASSSHPINDDSKKITTHETELHQHSVSSTESDTNPIVTKMKKTKSFRKSSSNKDADKTVDDIQNNVAKSGSLDGFVKASKGRRKEEKLLQDVREIRNEQHQLALIEYVNTNYSKIESLLVEKRRLKRLIKAWNASYEKEHGRLPSSTERKGHLRELHEEYQQV